MYGLSEYIRDSNVVGGNILDRIVNPEDPISHKELSNGTALILSNSGKMRIMDENASTVYLKKLDLILESTRFGVVKYQSL